MAQSVLKPCEICMGGPGTHYCLQCQQYFCGICKAQHNRQKVSRNHEFQSGENVVQEVKLRCEEHKEDFLFRCDKCKVSICMQCVTGKHNGHKMSNMKETISDLRKTFRKEIDTKLDVIQTSGQYIEEGLTTFDLSVTSVIHALTAEGANIKAMVDRHIEKMIATLKEKAGHEKESLTNMLSDCKQQLENAKAIEKREEKIRQSRDDAATIQHLQKLNDEISKLSVAPLPELPSVKYSPRSTSDSDVGQLIGTYSLNKTQTNKAGISPASYSKTQTNKAGISPASYSKTQTNKAGISPASYSKTQTNKAGISPASYSKTQTNKAGISPASYRSTVRKEETHGYLWRCSNCGYEDIYPVPSLSCPSCRNWSMGFIKEV